MKIRYAILIILISVLSFAGFMSHLDTLNKDIARFGLIGGYFFLAISFVNLMNSIGFKKF